MGRGRARFRTGYLSSASFSLRNFSRVFSFSVKSYGLTTGRQGFSGGSGARQGSHISSPAPSPFAPPPRVVNNPPCPGEVGGPRTLPAFPPPAPSYSIVPLPPAP